MPNFDLVCKECGHEVQDFKKGLRDPYPNCEVCDSLMQRNWSTMGSPGISWKGPGGSPLKGGGPTKHNFNMNESEVEQELYNSIYEEED